MTRGKFISIEGTEGAGKSTAVDFIRSYVEQAKHPIVVTREPGGTDIAEEIRRVVLHRVNDEVMQPETELLLMFASRAQHIHKIISPALNAGSWVLCDRFIDASYAYQGGGRGISMDFIAELDRYVVNRLYPELTFLLDLPVEVGMSRAERRNMGKDRIEKEKIDFFNRVRQTYLERAECDPERIKIIDASNSIEAVKQQIHGVLDTFFKKVNV